MKARIEIEIEDRFIEERVQDFAEDVASGELPADAVALTAEEYVRSRLEDLADDELRIALWGWPIKTKVVVG